MSTSTTHPRRARLLRWALGPLFALVSILALVPGALAAPRATANLPGWELLPPPSAAAFHGLAVVNRNVLWIGSDDGTVLRTLNGGRTWHDVTPPGAAGLVHFRDLQAFDADHVVAMTAGPGAFSRIYRTADGGQSWRLVFQAADPNFFFDAMAFFDNQRGLALSDPVDGKFQIVGTTDGGRTWTPLPTDGMPPALPNEFGIADSGTALTTSGNDAWFGSAGAASRIFHSRDGGYTWDVRPTPIVNTPALGAGIFSLAFRTDKAGLAVGGDFDALDSGTDVAAFSYFGSPWTLAPRQPSGLRSAVAWLPGTLATAVTVGFNGSDVSYDAGLHWNRFDDGEFNSVACADNGPCFAVGVDGRVAKLRL
jgi:photosystem II stability/assembly factor-like uncharacterized protein